MKTENRIDKSIDQLLSRFEQECNEDPDTLLSIHPKNYTTEHLYRLRGRWQRRYRQYKYFYSLFLLFGTLSPLLFSIGMTGFLFFPLLGVIFIPVSISAFMLFIIGMLYLSAKYKSNNHQEAVLRVIDAELTTRGQFVS